MKKQFLLFAATAVMFAACSSDDEKTVVTNEPVAARITAGLSTPATRAVDDKWNADRIGVMVTASPSSSMATMCKNVEYYTTSTGTTADFTAQAGGIFFQDASEQVTFSAYAPYQASATIDALPGTDGKVAVNTQDNNTAAAQQNIDFLFASGATATQQSPTVSFTDNTASSGTDCSFHHKMVKLNLVLQTSTTAGFAAADIFNVTAINLGGLIHEGTFDVTSGTAATTGTATAVDTWDILDCNYADNQTANTRTYTLILLPQDLSSSPLSIALTLGGQTYTNTTAINPNLEADKVYTYTITATKTGLKVSGCTITNWGSGTTGSGNATM